MRAISFTSLKTYIFLSLGILGIQIIIVCASLYFTDQKNKLDTHRLSFVRIEQKFLNNLASETPISLNEAKLNTLTLQYKELIELTQTSSIELPAEVIYTRIDLINKGHDCRSKQQLVHNQISDIMVALATSVSYIHGHHMAYLRNAINYGENPTSSEQGTFSRSSTSEGTEFDKIQSATSIQTSLLEVFAIFSLLQRETIPANINNTFDEAMTKFYSALNLFENYSLDAQDGLLVEELMVNGSVIEQSFASLLNFKNELIRLKIQANLNRDTFLSALNQAITKNEKQYFSIISRLDLSVKTLFALSIILFGALIAIGYRLIQALSKTVKETNHIRQDFNHRIPEHSTGFDEFGLIFKTLNLMAETATRKIDEFATIQAELEGRVQKRTEELHLKNKELEGEIKHKEIQRQEQKELEEKLSRAEKMEALGTLAGGVAHDLNNILSAIINYPELILLDLPEDHKLRTPLQKIQDSGRKAAVIVQDLLTMARRGVAQQEPIELNTLISSFIDCPECNSILESHPGITLKTTFQANTGFMRGSKIHLQKTLMNLITNAAESIIAEGTITISTCATYVDHPIGNYDHVREGEYIKLSISDTGIGISERDQEHIFEPFFTTKSLGRSGSGLGMSVVWGSVKDHGGYIDVKSQKMVGTTFELYFPRIRDSSEFSMDESTQDLKSGSGESILVIDDVQEQRDIASLMLTRLGYEVTALSSGEAAINYIRDHKVDLLVLDMIMHPGIDGLETYKQIIKIHPQQKAIIVSGFSENEKVTEAQALGTGAFVNKPYTLKDIGIAVRNELDCS